MDNSQLVFCKVEDIDLMNRQNEVLPKTEECEDCLGMGNIDIDGIDYPCEYCDIYNLSHWISEEDSDSDYVPNWSEDNDTDEDTFSEGSDMEVILTEDCGKTCNECVCYCGSV